MTSRYGESLRPVVATSRFDQSQMGNRIFLMYKRVPETSSIDTII